MSNAHRPPAEKSIFKVALTASAGATIEWYDFFIYGTAAALIFPHVFFPAGMSPLLAQLSAFSTFAVGFLARPFGGIVFGHFGDKIGRKKALLVALMTMGIATTGIGLLPSYESVGILSPILLIVLRLAQGVAVGGQWGGAALMAIESAPRGRAGFFGSFVQIGVPLGVVLANVVFFVLIAAMPQSAFDSWGWRIPFLLSIVLVFIGIFIQHKLEETPEFAEAAAQEAVGAPTARSPILQVLTNYPGILLLAGGAFIASNTCFYIAITYVVAYATAELGITRNAILGCVVFASVVMVPSLLICGALSDKWGRKPMFMAGTLLTGLWSLVMFSLIETMSVPAIALALTVELMCLAVMYGPQAALFAELFPVSIRYSGASLGYQLGAVIGGGFAPIIATALFARYASTGPITIYLFAICMISFVCIFFLARRTRTLVEAGPVDASLG